MTIEIEVEFPVVTRAFSRGGGSKLVMGTVDLTARIPELEEAAVPVAARVHSGVIDDEFRIDETGQFYWQLGRLPADEATFRARFGDWRFDQPGLLRMRHVAKFFGPAEREALKELFNKPDIAKPRRIADRRGGSYDQALVDAQIAERIEVLQRYALMEGYLFLRSQEPLMRVSILGHIYFQHGDPWQTLAPYQCFSLRELPEAVDLARRIQGKTPAAQPAVEILDEEHLSPSYLHERVALVNRYVLDLVQQYIARSSVDEVGRYLSRLADERELLGAVTAAADHLRNGSSFNESCLEAAERVLGLGRGSAIAEAIDDAQNARTVIEFLREAWDERPVSLQVGSPGRCHGSRIA
nr:hypothetical protein RNT25_04446 [arsenite-oxidising bacterium NT-25]